jgi:hypothetical protein
MTNELAPTTTTELARREVTPEAWHLIMSMAETIYECRLVAGVSKPEQAAFVLLKAYELGFPLSSVGDNLQVVMGKVALTSQGMLAKIQSRPDVVRLQIDSSTDESCTVTMVRSTGFHFTLTYSMQDAERAGLVRPDSTWKKYPANMCRWRAISMCARIVVPDLLAGLYLASELNPEAIFAAEEGLTVEEYREQQQQEYYRRLQEMADEAEEEWLQSKGRI